MRTLITVVFFAFAIHSRAQMTESYSTSSQALGKVYTSKFTRDQLSKTPVWRSQDDFPPLSPRKAEKAATAKFRKLLKDVRGWKCSDIFLDHPYDDEHWIYVVVFSPGDTDFEHLGDSVQIAVLMDGIVIEPSITEAK